MHTSLVVYHTIVTQLEVDKQQLNTERDTHALVPGPAEGKLVS